MAINNAIKVSVDVDLIYSADDGGYYFHRWSDNSVSTQTYSDTETALKDYDDERIEWEYGFNG
jgi:hypothetical protein